MDPDQLPIEDLDLSARTYNLLQRSDVATVGQLLRLTEDDLLDLPHFSRDAVQGLHEKMTQGGFNPPFAAHGDDDRA